MISIKKHNTFFCLSHSFLPIVISGIRRGRAAVGGQAEPHQRAVRCLDRRAAPLGLLGGHLHWLSRYQALAARGDVKIPKVQCLRNIDKLKGLKAQDIIYRV